MSYLPKISSLRVISTRRSTRDYSNFVFIAISWLNLTFLIHRFLGINAFYSLHSFFGVFPEMLQWFTWLEAVLIRCLQHPLRMLFHLIFRDSLSVMFSILVVLEKRILQKSHNKRERERKRQIKLKKTFTFHRKY